MNFKWGSIIDQAKRGGNLIGRDDLDAEREDREKRSHRNLVVVTGKAPP